MGVCGIILSTTACITFSFFILSKDLQSSEDYGVNIQMEIKIDTKRILRTELWDTHGGQGAEEEPAKEPQKEQPGVQGGEIPASVEFQMIN